MEGFEQSREKYGIGKGNENGDMSLSQRGANVGTLNRVVNETA